MMIRRVGRADRSEWLRLLVSLYAGTTSEEHVPDVDGYLAGEPAGSPPHVAVFVHERDSGGLGGVLELSVRNYAEGCTGETPYVESWYVDGDLRGLGVGRALLAAAERWAREQGYTEIASDTELDNRLSQQVHGEMGFVEVERSVHYRKAV
jgi:aminoglycoside 6'-N-acetyltransferase I